MIKCNCSHVKVCAHRKKLSDAFDGIIEGHYGGRNPNWTELDKLITRICLFAEKPNNTEGQ